MVERKTRTGQVSSMELLWGTRNRPSRGPKPRLSVEIIAVTAIEIADEEGLDGVSMQAVAGRLGYTAMSLYRYIPGKEQLLDVIYDVAIGPPPPARVGTDTADTTGSAADETWREGVRRHVWALLDVYDEHPWLLRIVTDTPPLGPHQLAWLDALLGTLSDTGLDDGEMIHLVTFVMCAVRDLVRTTSDLAQGHRRTGVPVERMGEEYVLAMRDFVDEARFPALARAVANGTFEPDGTPYHDTRPSLEFGLARLLDGVDAYLDARRR